MTEPLPEAADSESLTSALRRCGALTDGRVSAVAVESTRATILSKIVRLRLTYDRPAAGAPNTLIFKTGLPERLTGAGNGGRQEVAFYTEIASAMPAGLVPRCFEAEWRRGHETLAPPPRRPDRLASDRNDMAVAADARAVRADRSDLGALPRALVGRPAPRRLDRALGRRRRG